MSGSDIKHEYIGDELFRITVLPEGDHYRWTLTRADNREDAKSKFGEVVDTGFADDEHTSWTYGKAALNRFLVKKYIESEFAQWTINEFRTSMRAGQGFTVKNGSKALVVEVSDEFLEDFDSKKVVETLRLWRLADAMRAAGQEKFVIVTTEGLRTAPRREVLAD